MVLLALGLGCGSRTGLDVDSNRQVAGDGQAPDGATGAGDASVSSSRDGGERRAIAIAAGGAHACALLSTRTVECWGLNFSGQLGDGTTTDSPVPIAVAGPDGVMSITTGYDDTCALLTDGTVECWGLNENGQLGDGTTIDSAVPIAVRGVTNAIAFAGGDDFACALIAGGTVRCWGDGSAGELGNGVMTASPTPVAVSHLTGATAIAQGSTASQACALLSGGSARCWGLNAFGDLGSGLAASASATPVAVSNLTGAIELASGSEHVCALLAGGGASCWGDNEWGQLGDGISGEQSDTSAPVAVIGLTGAVQLAAGLLHTCARLATGGVQCWGLNESGQLGDGMSGESNDTSTPVDVLGVRRATSISAGAYYACALLESGQVACWGDNQYGELGDGTTNGSSTPVRVSL